MRVSEFVVLLVEDDPNDVLLFKHALTKAGLHVRLEVAESGLEAIEYVAGEGDYSNRVDHPIPGLIFLDLKLPVKSGLEVLEWLKGRPALKQFPVVVLTSSSEPSDIKRAYELGANSYLVKPSGMVGLLRIMEGIRGYWIGQNEASKPTVLPEIFERESRLPKKKPVLVVEDDRELREGLKATLQEAGFAVVEAANGEEALRFLGRNPSISVILLDVVLPVMDGWEFRAAQKRDPELGRIPVVVMSGFQKQIDDRPIDSDAFLPKPVRAEVLIETVRNCCGR